MKKTLIAAIIIFAVCKVADAPAQGRVGMARPSITGVPVLVYKTKKDYRNLVPVTLSDDKTHIVSYPDPNDLKRGGAYTLPTVLHKGYLLDNRGINKNVAFLKWTYQEYAALKQPPQVAELYKAIIDKDPLTKLYNCGPRHDKKNSIQHLNSLIDKKQLQSNCSMAQ